MTSTNLRNYLRSCSFLTVDYESSYAMSWEIYVFTEVNTYFVDIISPFHFHDDESYLDFRTRDGSASFLEIFDKLSDNTKEQIIFNFDIWNSHGKNKVN